MSKPDAKRIAVIGAGLMGHALALVFALGGHRVRLTDNSAKALEDAPGLIEKAAATLIAAGEIDASWTADKLRSVITTHSDLAETVADAAFIIEAVAERVDVKTALFAQLDELAPADAIIASNTSNLDVFPLIPKRRWNRAIITHWYTPPYLVDLVDVVPTPETDPAVTAEVKAMLEAMGKVPVVFSKFVTGYVANRLQDAIALEVFRLLDEGVVTAEEIDLSVIHGLALRMPIVGIMGKADFTGLELMHQNLANATYQPPAVTGQSRTLTALVEAGNGGVRSGRGFYDWKGASPADLFQDRDNRLLALKKALRQIKPMVPR
jgi:3-hydroxybutyryl-CoA dehydrogenase